MSEESYTRLEVREGIQDLLEQSGKELDQSISRIDLHIALLALPEPQRVALVMVASGYSYREISKRCCTGLVNPNKARRLVLAAENVVLEQLNRGE